MTSCDLYSFSFRTLHTYSTSSPRSFILSEYYSVIRAGTKVFVFEFFQKCCLCFQETVAQTLKCITFSRKHFSFQNQLLIVQFCQYIPAYRDMDWFSVWSRGRGPDLLTAHTPRYVHIYILQMVVQLKYQLRLSF